MIKKVYLVFADDFCSSAVHVLVSEKLHTDPL